MSSKLWLFRLLSVGLVLGLALVLRLYRLDSPLADWHSWRQADTASVTREFIKHNYPWWLPHYHDLSNIPSGLENPQGYRMVEFPIVNYLTAQWIVFTQSDLVITSRLVSIAFSLVAIGSLYALVWHLGRHHWTAWWTSFFMAALPYSIYYSRAILPEIQLVASLSLSLLFFCYWLDDCHRQAVKPLSWLKYLIAWLGLGLAFLLKPTAVFTAVVYLPLAWSYLGKKSLRSPGLYLFLLTPLPLAMWRLWISQFPEGIPAFTWLLNGNGIRLRPAWWRWLMAERLGKLILGYWGLIMLAAGLLVKDKKLSKLDILTFTWAAGMIAYLVVFATGNVQHDYYQVLLLPIISILLGRGVVKIWQSIKPQPHFWLLAPAGVMVMAMTFFMSWYELRGYFNINNPAIITAGRRLDELAPPDAKVIAPYQGDTAFLFQTNRTGWPIGGGIEAKISQGAQYYVTTTLDDEAKSLSQIYPIVESNPEYLILDLTP